MASELKFEESLLRKLKLDDPFLTPKPWESIPSESGGSVSLSSRITSSRNDIYDLSSVSEASVVRLVMHALQGVHSSVLSIKHLSALFCSYPADRSNHRIPSLWNRSLSTHALGDMLKSIGFTGSLVIFLYNFVDYFSCSSVYGGLTEKHQEAELDSKDDPITEMKNMDNFPHSLINQAFAVAVRNVLEGYLSALNTLNASVHVRRCSNGTDSLSNLSQWQDSLTGVAHSEVTLLEIYLHTRELRTQIEGLGHLCHLHDAVHCFSLISSEDLSNKAIMQFHDFPRGGNLLTYLYRQLQIVDPTHYSLLKYLFLRSLEPYCGLIRSWIYEAKIDDPYGDFIVEHGVHPLPNSHHNAGHLVDFPLATIKEQDGVSVPCFLQSVLVPLLRAGQQLQVVMRLLRLCNYAHAGECSFEDILPGSSDFMCDKVSCSPLSFDKRELEASVLSRRNFYCKMHEKLESIMKTLDIRYRQVVLHDTASVYACSSATLDSQLSSTMKESVVLSTGKENPNHALQAMDSDASTDEDISSSLDPRESSDCSSADDIEEEADSTKFLELRECLASSKQKYFSALCFSSCTEEGLVHLPQTEQKLPVQNDMVDSCDEESLLWKNGGASREPEEILRSWVSELQFAGHMPDLGWPIGGLLENPLKISHGCRGVRNSQHSGNDHEMRLGVETLDEIASCSTNQFSSGGVLRLEESDRHEYTSSNSFLIQSWNAKYPFNVLSMNPMLTKDAFLNDLGNLEDSTSKIIRTFTCFDFSTTTDPFMVYKGLQHAEQQGHIKPEFSSFSGTSSVRHIDSCVTTSHDTRSTPVGKDHMDHGGTSNLKSDRAKIHLKDSCGGSSWQSLLHGSTNISDATVRDYAHTADPVFEIPLDFIIDKCLLQEILLQYIYVSRLTIKLLEGGFDLQGHFLALRRYHFMETADWADLFITSLWDHKWYFTVADQKIPEVQGLLELSLQRSSCEKDHNKDRLYVYVRDQDKPPLSTEVVGIHSFDFIGLGYRVDWPVSIVLTPSALSIYAQIFTFLIQVKLAVLSLTDVWSSLKGFRHFSKQSNGQHILARSNFNYLVKLRHQVNHFVSALQQYVLSQLSHVSWCKFRSALKHEVKDMMDLESLHMAYLRDSVHICFLADETLPISNNINNILQCALDFRSCLVKGTGDVGSDNQDPLGRMSHINVSVAHSIKDKFYKSLKELHLLYLKSPNHGEHGLSQFWTHLDYNEYYSEALGEEMSRYNPFVR